MRRSRSFQSTRPRGARQEYHLNSLVFYSFQSTRPRGARLEIPADHRRTWSGFNPRARAGRDMDRYTKKYTRHRFQSTRPRGARPNTQRHRIPARKFQSTRPRGARLEQRLKRKGWMWFQSTRPRGARHTIYDTLKTCNCFNPRARAGRDPRRRRWSSD